jgi:predicted oxidoreductase (fatty acid repression mutant protein)
VSEAILENKFLSAIAARRTQYVLGKNIQLDRNDTTQLIREAIRQAPSPFNSQSSRAIILFGRESEKLWSLTAEALRQLVPFDAFELTQAKLDSFAAGAGTVLFYEDMEVVRDLQERFSLYAENFPIWSEQSSGMAQFAVWAALADAEIGASLQHYNPLIDEVVAQTWQVPGNWKLRAQMPFGSNEQPIPEKTFMDDGKRFKVFG